MKMRLRLRLRLIILTMALILSSNFLQQSAKASETVAQACVGPNIRNNIKRPFYLDQAYGKKFDYKFEFRQPKDKSQPVVIFLPGGPGENSIGKMAEMTHIPEEFGLILTDPRGVGCNQVPGTYQNRFYGTPTFAADVIAIIRKLGLKNYIIYGHSYGTVLATETTHLIEHSHLPAPRAVVLEGVLGKALNNINDYVEPKLAVWHKIKNQLSPSQVTELSKVNLLGYSNEVWGLLIAGLIVEAGDRIILPLLSGLAPANAGAKSQLLQMLEKIKGISFENPPMERLWMNVACKELMESSPGFASDFFLQNGDLVPYNKDVCGKIDLVQSLKYDAAHFLVKTPIFYFTGELDIATTEDQAEYHFKSQNNPANHLIKVYGGGHKSLSFNLQDCSQDIFRAIGLSSLNRLHDALLTCSSPIDVK